MNMFIYICVSIYMQPHTSDFGANSAVSSPRKLANTLFKLSFSARKPELNSSSSNAGAFSRMAGG